MCARTDGPPLPLGNHELLKSADSNLVLTHLSFSTLFAVPVPFYGVSAVLAGSVCSPSRGRWKKHQATVNNNHLEGLEPPFTYGHY